MRAPHVGRLLTAQQYASVGSQRVILSLLPQARHPALPQPASPPPPPRPPLPPPLPHPSLAAQAEHELALRIARQLNLKALPPLIAHDWSIGRIRAAAASEPDASLLAALSEKLAAVVGASFAGAATEAHRVGRSTLATMLLEYEPRPARQVIRPQVSHPGRPTMPRIVLPACHRQVPLLLEMGETHVALSKAAASGDTDLLYLALLHGMVAVDAKQLNATDFFRMCALTPPAQQLLVG